jgi:hypothetical protein
MGEDSYPNIRSDQHTPRGLAHLPEVEVGSAKMIKFGSHSLLYRFLQVTHRVSLCNVDWKDVVGHVENPTEKFQLVI